MQAQNADFQEAIDKLGYQLRDSREKISLQKDQLESWSRLSEEACAIVNKMKRSEKEAAEKEKVARRKQQMPDYAD